MTLSRERSRQRHCTDEAPKRQVRKASCPRCPTWVLGVHGGGRNLVPSCHVSMTERRPRFEAAVERFDAIHREAPDGGALVYHARLSGWVDALSASPSEALQLAARCQHIRRWALPRATFPAGLSGYKRWRTTLAQRHAEEAAAILAAVGYDDATIARVRVLLLKEGLKTDEEVQLFEDAICLSFLEGELEAFARQHDEDKLVRILQKTWRKMSPRGHAAALELAGGLTPSTRALLERALPPPTTS